MESVLTRYRNVTILVAVLFAQILGLAIQVKRTTANESSSLIRIWALDLVTPLERGIVDAQMGIAGIWRNYFYLRGVRAENRQLKQQIERLQMEQVRLSQDAEQARRLQVLLGFKEQFVSQTIAAQVIGSSGSEQSRSIFIDKGTLDELAPDMAVITAEGVVGKVLHAYKSTSEVLLINDQTSGVGSILEQSRLQGVLRGTVSGDLLLDKVMNDEQVQPGERVLTSGGDQIFPKGLLIGTVRKSSRGSEAFLDVRVKPAADLGRLEEVLVITQKEDRTPEAAEAGPIRAVDILADRLPSVPVKPLSDKPATTNGTAAPNPLAKSTSSANTATKLKPKAPAPQTVSDAPPDTAAGEQAPPTEAPQTHATPDSEPAKPETPPQ
jgi:rod shape-determining protein MreC